MYDFKADNPLSSDIQGPRQSQIVSDLCKSVKKGEGIEMRLV